jgi:hypothetical protein
MADGINPSRALLLMISVCVESKTTGETPRQVWHRVRSEVVGCDINES